MRVTVRTKPTVCPEAKESDEQTDGTRRIRRTKENKNKENKESNVLERSTRSATGSGSKLASSANCEHRQAVCAGPDPRAIEPFVNHGKVQILAS